MCYRPILFFCLFIAFHGTVVAQEDQSSDLDSTLNKKSTDEYEDISDDVVPAPLGFELGVGPGMKWSTDDGAQVNEFLIPYLNPRYGFSEHFGFQSELSVDNEHTKDSSHTEINTILDDVKLGLVYIGNPHDGQEHIFSQFSLNWWCTLPIYAEDVFLTQLRLNWSTELNKTFELDYTFAYGIQPKGDQFTQFSLELDWFLRKNIMFESYLVGTREWKGTYNAFKSRFRFDLAFLTHRNHQFNITYTQGMNFSFHEFVLRYYIRF